MSSTCTIIIGVAFIRNILRSEELLGNLLASGRASPTCTDTNFRFNNSQAAGPTKHAVAIKKEQQVVDRDYLFLVSPLCGFVEESVGAAVGEEKVLS